MKDTSADAEDAVIRRGAELFGDLAVPVEVHHPGGLGDRQVPVPAQPAGHRLEPVDLRGSGHLGLAHRAGHLGGEPVLRHQQRAQPVQQRRAERRRQVLAGQGVECGVQLVHDTSHRLITCSKPSGWKTLPQHGSGAQRLVHRSATGG